MNIKKSIIALALATLVPAYATDPSKTIDTAETPRQIAISATFVKLRVGGDLEPRALRSRLVDKSTEKRILNPCIGLLNVFADDSAEKFLREVENERGVDIMTAPVVTTAEKKKAIVRIGNSQDDNIKTQLAVTPTIQSKNVLALQINLVYNTSTGHGINRREYEAEVSLLNGSTVVLGGIVSGIDAFDGVGRMVATEADKYEFALLFKAAIVDEAPETPKTASEAATVFLSETAKEESPQSQANIHVESKFIEFTEADYKKWLEALAAKGATEKLTAMAAELQREGGEKTQWILSEAETAQVLQSLPSEPHASPRMRDLASGKRYMSRMVREYPYPTEWEKNPDVKPDAPQEYIPTKWEIRPVGVTLAVQPTVSDAAGKVVKLEYEPEYTDVAGFFVLDVHSKQLHRLALERTSEKDRYYHGTSVGVFDASLLQKLGIKEAQTMIRPVFYNYYGSHEPRKGTAELAAGETVLVAFHAESPKAYVERIMPYEMDTPYTLLDMTYPSVDENDETKPKCPDCGSRTCAFRKGFEKPLDAKSDPAPEQRRVHVVMLTASIEESPATEASVSLDTSE